MNVSDDFNRADSTTSLGTSSSGHAWIAQSGTWGIDTNRGYLAASGGVSQQSAVLETSESDGTVAVTLAVYGQEAGLVFRAVDDSNYLLLNTSPTLVELFQRVTGAFTSLNSAAATVASGDILSAVLSGTSITVKQNGTTLFTQTTSQFQTATKHGLRINGGATLTPRLDDFSFTGSGSSPALVGAGSISSGSTLAPPTVYAVPPPPAGSATHGTSSEAGAAANVTMSWALSTAQYWAMLGVSVKPSQSPAYFTALDEQALKAVVAGGMFAEVVGVVENETPLSRMSSLAQVEADRGRWYYDRAAKRLYMQTTSPSGSPNVLTYGAAVRRLRLSSQPVGFRDQPMYYPLLTGTVPEVREEVSQSVSAVSPIAGGTISCLNNDKRFDAISRSWHWRNRRVTMRHGGVRGTGYALQFGEYETIGALLISDVSADDANFHVKLRVGDSVERSLPTTTWGALLPGVFGFYDPTLPGQYAPIVLGVNFDVPLTPIVAGAPGWQACFVGLHGSSTPSTVSAVRAKHRATGVVTTLGLSDYIVQSEGRGRVDVSEATYHRDAYDFFVDLAESGAANALFGTLASRVLRSANVLSDELNMASFFRADADAPYPLGVYVPGGAFPTTAVTKVLADLATSVLGRVYVATDGRWHARVWSPSADHSTIPHLQADTDLQSWVSQTKLESVVKGVRLHYARRQGSNDPRTTQATSALPEFQHATKDVIPISTLLANEADAVTMAHRYLMRLQQPTATFEAVERGLTLLARGAWDAVQVTRARAMTALGTYTRERFEILQVIKQLSPASSVQVRIGDMAGLRGRVRAWVPASFYHDMVRDALPVGWWKLNETSGSVAADASGAANHGTLVSGSTSGMVSAATSTAGALSDGDLALLVTGVVVVPDISASVLTLEIWHKRDDAASSNSWRALFANNLATNRHHLTVRDTDRQLGVRDDTAFAGSGFVVPDDGAWHHYAAVLTSAASVSFYVDGVFVSAASTTLNLATYPVTAIGNLGNGLGGAHAGYVDEPAVYNRALTAAELRAHYVAASRLQPYATARDDDRQTYMFWADADGRVNGSAEPAFIWW